MVNVPVRTALVGFDDTVTLTVPPPLPLAPLVMDIQPLSDVAVHVHWLAALTVTELDPPDASNDRDDAERVYVQGAGVGSVGELLLQARVAAASRTDRARQRDEPFHIAASNPAFEQQPGHVRPVE